MWWETTPQNHRKWSCETGVLSSQVQMYRNVGRYYWNSGLSLEVGLSSRWSPVKGFTVYKFISCCLFCWQDRSRWDNTNVERLIHIALYGIERPIHIALYEIQANSHCSVWDRKANSHCSVWDRKANSHCSVWDRKVNSHCSVWDRKVNSHCSIWDKKSDSHCSIWDKKADSHCSIWDRKANSYCSVWDRQVNSYWSLWDRQAGTLLLDNWLDIFQGPEFSAIIVNTTVKTEPQLENGIHLRKWISSITVVNLRKYHRKTQFHTKISNLANKIQIYVQNNKFHFL